MATTATAAPGKTDFVKDILQNDPEAKAKAVNQAWQDARFRGHNQPHPG